MKLLVIDCDSTLSALEGIDELARLKGAEVFKAVEHATTQAMDGSIPIDEIFAKRLDLIQPTVEDCAAVGQLYIDHVIPDAKEVLVRLQDQGWRVIVLSGGFVQCIQPFTDWLGLSEIEAVPLKFHANGHYEGFEDYPTTRNGGKPEVILELKQKYQPRYVVMVGDGVSDLETKSAVDLFIGFGGVVERAKVKSKSDAFVHQWSEVETLLAEKSSQLS